MTERWMNLQQVNMQYENIEQFEEVRFLKDKQKELH